MARYCVCCDRRFKLEAIPQLCPSCGDFLCWSCYTHCSVYDHESDVITNREPRGCSFLQGRITQNLTNLDEDEGEGG